MALRFDNQASRKQSKISELQNLLIKGFGPLSAPIFEALSSIGPSGYLTLFARLVF